MKKYLKPELDTELLDVEDIITVSGGAVGGDQGTGDSGTGTGGQGGGEGTDPEQGLPEIPDIDIDNDIIDIGGGNPIQELMNDFVLGFQSRS